MRISELSQRSGVSMASIKYYTREGLLPAGERTGYNQTDYSEQHLARLRLLRALIEAGGLTIAHARTVLTAADQAPATSAGTALGPSPPLCWPGTYDASGGGAARLASRTTPGSRTCGDPTLS